MTQLVPAAHPDSKQADSSPAQKKGVKTKLRLLIPLGILVGMVGFGVWHWLTQPDDSAIQLSGRIEGYDSDLGTKVGGRIQSVAVREGDAVRQGQTIARLDDRELLAQLNAANARMAAAREQLNQAQLQVNVVESQVREAQLTLQQSEGDTAGRVSEATASVATAEAQLAVAQAQAQQADSTLVLARIDRDRFSLLLEQGAISQQEFDRVRTEFETAQDTLAARQAAIAAAQQQVSAAEGVLTQAQTSQINPDIRTAQVARTQMQLKQARAQLAAVQAELEQARAEREEIVARLDDLEIKSPIDGVVVTRMVEPGEVISVGTPVLTVVNLGKVYLRGYIPESQVGDVRVGQSARIFLDSAPDRPLAARVSAVDTEASFTPENIYFREDRVTQVFGLRLSIDNPRGFAKPGMPADGEILLDQQEKGE